MNEWLTFIEYLLFSRQDSYVDFCTESSHQPYDCLPFTDAETEVWRE